MQEIHGMQKNAENVDIKDSDQNQRKEESDIFNKLFISLW